MHSNITVSHGLNFLKNIPKSGDAITEHHNFQKSFSNSNMNLLENFDNNSLVVSHQNKITSNSHTNFHLYDIPNNDFDIKSGLSNHLKSLPMPVRPPPPPPKPYIPTFVYSMRICAY